MTVKNVEEIELKPNKTRFQIMLGLLILGALILFSMTLGRFPITFIELANWLCSAVTDWSSIAESQLTYVFVKIRLPRIILAVFSGAALAAAGAAYQGIFCNPMVSPDILGASAGAGFGAAIGILFSLPFLGIQLTAFVFGLLAVGVSIFITSAVGRNYNVILVLVLAGMIVSSMFGSFLAVIKYIADPYGQLPEITFWLMGSLTSTDMKAMGLALPILIFGLALLFFVRWRINIMTFGEEEARAMGVNTTVIRLIVIAGATLITSVVVSVCGQIAWIGLVIPHLSRMITGPDYTRLLPLSMLMGGAYLLIVDDISRTAMATEIPIGILTSLIGAPFFLFLLFKTGKKRR